MATLDGLTLHVLVSELKTLLTGGRVDKINQPDRDELNITVRNGGINYRLLICVRPDSCRVQLTDAKKPNPAEAPMFCMLLRKYLTGGRIVSVTQPDTDRIVRFEIESTDELYNTDRFYLVCELMGRHSNIILVNSDGMITDCIKRVGIDMSQARLLMPNIKYELPPTEKKADPLQAEMADIEAVLSKEGRADKLLPSAFYGVAPVAAACMAERAAKYSGRENLCCAVKEALEEVKSCKAVYLVKRGEKEQFLPFRPVDCEYTEYESPSAMLDEYYTERDRREYMRRRSYALLHAVEQKLSRAEKKLSGFDIAIASEGDYEKYRKYGELLITNSYRIRPGQGSVQVEDYYENPPTQIEIPLDNSLSPMRNSQRYFKLYKKAKGARDTALAMREDVLGEIEYLQGVRDCIMRADCNEALDEIRAELEEQKYIRREHTKKQKRVKKQPPKKFVSSDGYEIYVGRNNYQNDELTFRIASPRDIWLHVKDRPGSHTVIINKTKGDEVPETTLYEAAKLAAEHSSAGEGGAKVEVDYTFCKFVKKPSGALPGKVIYTNQKTIMVVP